VTVYVAMLRGVNVGARNKVRMAELEALFFDLGHTDVVTYIQSGNVVFTSAERSSARVAEGIEQGIARDLGLDVTTLVRTRKELAAVAAANPFVGRGAELSRLHVTFLAERAGAELAGSIDPSAGGRDEFAVVGREVYLHCPGGYGTTKLNNAFWERRLGAQATTRNWNTVTRLLALSRTCR
jgi:uncharacterized protein (DUF1697 family)